MKTINKHAGIRILIAPALLCLFLLNSCMKMNEPVLYNNSSNSTLTQAANEVSIQGMAFSPATLTITAGTTVNWTNIDGVSHTVTSDTAGLFDSGTISGSNGTYSHLFSTAGTFNYHCAFHPSMTAKVVVN
jgi:plastocyanin